MDINACSLLFCIATVAVVTGIVIGRAHNAYMFVQFISAINNEKSTLFNGNFAVFGRLLWGGKRENEWITTVTLSILSLGRWLDVISAGMGYAANSKLTHEFYVAHMPQYTREHVQLKFKFEKYTHRHTRTRSRE